MIDDVAIERVAELIDIADGCSDELMTLANSKIKEWKGVGHSLEEIDMLNLAMAAKVLYTLVVTFPELVTETNCKRVIAEAQVEAAAKALAKGSDTEVGA